MMCVVFLDDSLFEFQRLDDSRWALESPRQILRKDVSQGMPRSDRKKNNQNMSTMVVSWQWHVTCCNLGGHGSSAKGRCMRGWLHWCWMRGWLVIDDDWFGQICSDLSQMVVLGSGNPPQIPSIQMYRNYSPYYLVIMARLMWLGNFLPETNR